MGGSKRWWNSKKYEPSTCTNAITLMKRIINKVAKSGYIGPILDRVPLLDREKLRNRYKRCILSKHEKKVMKRANGKGTSVLLSGYPKSGNTWTRFVVFNYLNIKYRDANDTLTYDELNNIQSTVISRKTDIRDCLNGELFFARTHVPYYKVYSSFDIILYAYRNPLDTLISSYHSQVSKNNIDDTTDITDFIRDRIEDWVKHFNKTFDKSDIVLSYEKRKNDPYYEFEKVIKFIDKDLNDECLKKSIKLSGLKNIRSMEKKSGQRYGNYPGYESELPDDYNFTRSGEVGQYKKELPYTFTKNCKDYIRKNNIMDYLI
jgi:hypothetical protein